MFRPLLFASLAAVAACLLAAAGVATARADAGHDRRLTYDVLRDGSRIGTQVIDIHGTPSDASVEIKTDVVFRIAYIPVYRFEQTSHEEWRNGRLDSLVSKTNDDGDDHDLAVRRSDDGLVAEIDGARHVLPATLLPASLWNPSLIGADTWLDTIDGRAMAVSVADKGDELVDVHGAKRQARHYVVSGDLSRELWFDGSGTLVRVRFAGKDDSRIDYVLE